MNRPFINYLQIAGLFMLLLLPFSASGESKSPTIPPEQQKRILILNSYHLSYSWSDQETAGILNKLKETQPRIEPIVEYLDCKFFPQMDHFEHVAQLFSHKFKHVQIPLIIALDNPALDFALTYRKSLFPNAPIVFCGINGFSPAILRGARNVTGVAEVLDSHGTVKMMLRQHPKTRQIFIIHDYTSTGLATRRETEAQLAPLASQVVINYMPNFSTAQMLSAVSKLPSDALVLALSYSRDSEGRIFNHPQIAELLSKNSSVPVYATHQERLGAGIIGGNLLSGNLHGAQAAALAVRILNGAAADSIPIETSNASIRPMFDYHQLQRFNVSPELLPSDAIIINQPETFYHKYRFLVWLTAAVFLLLLSCNLLFMYVAGIRKRANLQLEEKANELEQRVKDRTLDLETTNQRLVKEAEQHRQAREEISWLNEDLLAQRNALEESNHELEAFSYSVSHDLRAPLRHVNSFATMLREDCLAQLTDSGKSYLERICIASQRMGALIDDLLAFTRLSRTDLRKCRVDLSQLSREVTTMFQEINPDRSINVTIADGLHAKADSHLMESVLQNLIGNAWKYTAHSTDASIEVGSETVNGEIVYFVRDNGAGFDMAYHDKLFGVFQRLHGKEYEGTGIGLATVKRIIERHGGKIWGEGKINEGAIFRFTLPE